MNNINQIKNEFFNKCFLKEKKNCKYSNQDIIASIVVQATQGQYLESAHGMSPDTIQRRINLGKDQEMAWLCEFNSRTLELVPFIIHRNRCVRWNIIIDDSLDAFFGDFEKEKLFLQKNNLPDFLSGYKVDRGSTGSFEYVVVALHSSIGTFPLMVLPKIAYTSMLQIIEVAFKDVKRSIPGVIVLADRGFGNQEFIGLCQRIHIGYCVRLKTTGELKTAKKYGRTFFWHEFGDIKFRIVMHTPHGKDTFFFAVGQMGGTSQWYRLLYKKRWSIENLFKNSDMLQLRTSSRNSLMRLFCFTLSMLLIFLFQLMRITDGVIKQTIRKVVMQIFGVQLLIITNLS